MTVMTTNYINKSVTEKKRGRGRPRKVALPSVTSGKEPWENAVIDMLAIAVDRILALQEKELNG